MKSVVITFLTISAIAFLMMQNNQNQFLSLTQSSVNDQPIIGIMTLPSEYDEYPSTNYAYLAASYVKFIESAGARVVPIPFEASNSTLEKIFQKINGVLITGGGIEIDGPTKFTQSVSYMVHRAIEVNDQGTYFPVMAICLGHQTLHYIIGGYPENLLIRVQGEQAIAHSLDNAVRNALFYKDMSDQLFDALTHEKISYYNHNWAISPSFYDGNPLLKNFFQITALNTDIQGTTFIASAQAYKYPILTIQYHPEKANFEWKIPAIHSLNAIKATQHHGDVFIDMARKNFHSFDQTLINKAVIYNYQPIQLADSSFQQLYIFKLGDIEKIYN